MFALPMTAAELEVYRRHTARTAPPAAPVREAWQVVGRRGGKSRNAALAALYLAVRRNHAELLVPGERGVMPVIAADRKQAGQVLGYLKGLARMSAFAPFVARVLKESVEFRTGITVEVHSGSFRTRAATRSSRSWPTSWPSGARTSRRARTARSSTPCAPAFQTNTRGSSLAEVARVRPVQLAALRVGTRASMGRAKPRRRVSELREKVRQLLRHHWSAVEAVTAAAPAPEAERPRVREIIQRTRPRVNERKALPRGGF
ncbi:MAG TPA: hypothetical protein VEK77_14330 [Gemmatimonadales bacterium]|nr:hypothetical protein [Gemmatimonadales bacterium]